MKSLAKILVFVLAVVTAFAFTACSDKESDKSKQLGYAFEVDSEVVDTTEEGAAEKTSKKVLTIKGFFVGQGTLDKLENDEIEKLDLVIGGTGDNGKFNVYDSVKGDFQFGDDGNASKTDNFDEYDEIVIDKDAFSNQTYLGTVELTDKVVKVGEASFAGCSNITKMTLPFVGTEKDAINAGKTFASIFGGTEVTGCTSVSVSYNASGSSTYYVPSGLTEIVVNFAEENTELNSYAFNGLTTVEKVVLKNVVELGTSAFEGCTSLKNVEFDNVAALRIIGKAAFKGCTSLYGMNLSEFAGLEMVYQEAFSGCTRLGLGFAVVKLPGASYMEKAFAGCTTLKTLDLSDANYIGESCFNGCTSLESLTPPGASGHVENGAFLGCTKLIDNGTVDELGNLPLTPLS